MAPLSWFFWFTVVATIMPLSVSLAALVVARRNVLKRIFEPGPNKMHPVWSFFGGMSRYADLANHVKKEQSGILWIIGATVVGILGDVALEGRGVLTAICFYIFFSLFGPSIGAAIGIRRAGGLPLPPT